MMPCNHLQYHNQEETKQKPHKVYEPSRCCVKIITEDDYSVNFMGKWIID